MPKILRWHRLSQRQSKCGVAAEIRIRFMVNLPKHGLRTCIAPRVNGSNIFVEILRPEKDRSASLMPADGTRVICRTQTSARLDVMCNSTLQRILVKR
jgi:hypothetical protein